MDLVFISNPIYAKKRGENIPNVTEDVTSSIWINACLPTLVAFIKVPA